MVPFMLPLIMFDALVLKTDRNPLHDGKRKLTGKKKVAVSETFKLDVVKKASKDLNLTINELLLVALSSSMKKWFEELGDTKSNKIQIGMPVNIRWEMYQTFDEVQLENRFAPMQLKVELFKDHEKAIERVGLVTRAMKKLFTKTYATYALTRAIGWFVPAFLAKITGDNLTKPFTLTFSNVPGILRKITYKEVDTTGMFITFITAGRCAVSVNVLSYCENIQFTCLMDTSVGREPADFVKRYSDEIREVMKLADRKALEKAGVDETKKEK